MKKDRIAGIDILKVIASIFVISIHQLGQTHAVQVNMEGAATFFVMMYRYAVMSSVPLFIMITGYLQCHKTASVKFYKGIIPIFLTYLLSTAITVIIQAALGDEITFESLMVGTFGYTQIGYAWYVEMYVGLYLLIPFINMMLGKTRRQRALFIAVMVLLTVVPSIPTSLSSPEHQIDIFPDYWVNFYPIVYYAIGSYIREYNPKPNKIVIGVLLAAAILFPVIAQFYRADGGEFADYVFNGFFSVSAFLTAVFIFLMLYDVDIKEKHVKAVFANIASCSLELYLLSFILERVIYFYWIYPAFGTSFPGELPIMIAILFICSYFAAVLQKLIAMILKLPFNLIYNNIRTDRRPVRRSVRETGMNNMSQGGFDDIDDDEREAYLRAAFGEKEERARRRADAQSRTYEGNRRRARERSSEDYESDF